VKHDAYSRPYYDKAISKQAWEITCTGCSFVAHTVEFAEVNRLINEHDTQGEPWEHEHSVIRSFHTDKFGREIHEASCTCGWSTQLANVAIFEIEQAVEHHVKLNTHTKTKVDLSTLMPAEWSEAKHRFLLTCTACGSWSSIQMDQDGVERARHEHAKAHEGNEALNKRSAKPGEFESTEQADAWAAFVRGEWF
jgi:hypothetical protein